MVQASLKIERFTSEDHQVGVEATERHIGKELPPKG